VIEDKFVDLYARNSGLRDKLVAERDVVLTYALRALFDAGAMDHLAFKGGTCLRKIVFGSAGRFSEDLDFTVDSDGPEDDVLEQVVETFNREHYGITFCFDDYYKTEDDLSFGGDEVRPNPSGCDFSILLDAENVGVEVYSPQHRSERASTEPEVSVRHGIRMELIETAPFGLPERSIDNVQGEAVSRIAQAKGDESQLKGHDAYVLWMDFQDPLLWALVPDLGQVRPFSTFQGAATSGAFWSAFYGRTGMPVFDSLSFESGDHSIYRMEFEGRFSRESVLDLVILSLISGTVVYQNPNRSTQFSDDFFRKLHLLPGVKPELCWLDWPARGRLVERVALARSELEAYATFFEKL
jgi:hypothetical protein